MRAQATGAVDLRAAVGREPELRSLWTSLDTGSVLLHGRRGLGKTTLLRLAMANAPAQWLGRRLDLSSLERPIEAGAALVHVLWREHPNPPADLSVLVQPLLDDRERLSIEAFGQAEAGWEQVLRLAIEQVLDAELESGSGSGRALVLALDHFEDFCVRVRSRGLESSLGSFVRTLLELAAERPRLRLLLTFEGDPQRALDELPKRPLADATGPLMRAAQLELCPLPPESSTRLASALLIGEDITAQNRVALTRALVEACDGVPGWLHAAVQALAERHRKPPKPVLDGDLERTLDSLFAAPASALDDPNWQLRQAFSPVLERYWMLQRSLSLPILDAIALSEDGALSFRALRKQLSVQMTIDDDAIYRVLETLHRDQLVEEFGGRWRFCAGLLRRAWLALRELN